MFLLFVIQTHVVKFLVYEGYLSIGQTKRLSTDNLFDDLELVDNEWVSALVAYFLQIGLEDDVIKRVVTHLFGSQSKDCTTNFKQIFSDVALFSLRIILANIDVYVKILFRLLEHQIQSLGLLHHTLLVDKAQLIQHINQIYHVRLLDLVFYNLTKLVIKLPDKDWVGFIVYDFDYSLISIFHCLTICLINFYSLSLLLVNGLLVEHVKGHILVSWAHDTWLLVDDWRE